MMKKIILLSCMVLASVCCIAQNAKEALKVLDKTAAIVGRNGGAYAGFSISGSKLGATNGTIAIKGNKFYAHTPQATVWFNGKTQWAYMKATNEVNVTTPNEAKQAQMNPYKFITLYKSGYNLTSKKQGNAYQIHMVAQDKKRSIQELYITIGKNYIPSQVKMRQGTNWTTINITNFKAKNQSDAVFTFNAKEFPKAEVIDLR